MNSLWSTLLGGAILGIPATLAAWLTYRSASRAQERSAEVEDKKVDQAAFEAAQGIYERGIAEANREIGRVRADLDAARKEASQLRADLDTERRETGRLRSRVLVLERLITTNNLPLPTGD